MNEHRPTWHYGPTDSDPDPGKMWCYGCGREVFFFSEGCGCERCGWFEDPETGEATWSDVSRETNREHR